MSSTVQDLGPCTKKVAVTIGADHVNREVERNYQELRSTLTLPGFRRGKAPRSLIEKRFASHVLQDVKHDVIVQGIDEAVKEHKLDIVSAPDVDVEAITVVLGTDLAFEFTVEVKPEIELPVYKGLDAKRITSPVTDEDVTRVIDGLRDRMADLVPVEGEPAQEKDFLIGSVELVKDGKVELEMAQVHAQAGVDEHIDTVPLDPALHKLVGARTDQPLIWTVTLPDDYRVAPLRGVAVTATFNAREIKRVRKADVEEIARNYECETEDALRAKIRTRLEEDAREAAETNVEESLIDTIIAQSDFAVPESVLNRTLAARVQKRVEQLYTRMLYAGQKPDDEKLAELARGMREEERRDAERSIRAWYLMERIAKKEKLFATEEDLERKTEELAVRQRKTPTQVREELVKEEMYDAMRMEILEEKVRKLLKDNAKIVDEVGQSKPADQA
jgi:trigger factor